ncbi:unnamed protein product [Onchocerca flexuosa]|uniref:Uncharacterized protein n=1 Tax=Onchocerca flexuosa TaxID=387005 RepID=A0A183I2R0_9BILA|nr:unnamed protein product [Onchocerca flexuosa]
MMAMTPNASTDNTNSIASQTPVDQSRKYYKAEEQQKQLSPEQQKQHLQPLQHNSPSFDCLCYQNNSNHHRNASPFKQQSTSSSATSSTKFKLPESFRESLHDLHVPKIWSNLRKSASDLGIILEAMRYRRSLTYLEMQDIPFSKSTKGEMAKNNASKSIRNGLAMQKRKRRKAKITWQNYSPHQLNKQIQYGN